MKVKLPDNRMIGPHPVIIHTFPLRDFVAAIETIKVADAKAGKVVLLPEGK